MREGNEVMIIDAISYLIDKFYLIPIITFVIYGVKLLLNHAGASDLERKFMTNYKNFLINLFLILFVSLIIASSVFTYLYSEMVHFPVEQSETEITDQSSGKKTQQSNLIGREADVEKDDENITQADPDAAAKELSMIEIFILIYIIVLTGNYSIVLLCGVFFDLYRPKKKYYFLEKGSGNNEEKWYITKYVGDKFLFVESVKGSNKVIKDWFDKEIYSEHGILNRFQLKIKNKLRNYTIIHLVSITIILLIIIYYKEIFYKSSAAMFLSLKTFLIAICFIIIVSLIVLFIVFYQRFIKKVKDFYHTWKK